ncbi:MAG: hypothetical protein PHS49_03550 [Candidatus Gracilibacteria bacterium]|nr:hypothetical protein [Candidatus Gracilibacteria bacterium]
MHSLSQALLYTDSDLEGKILSEIEKLKTISQDIPFSISNLLEEHSELSSEDYFNGFLDRFGDLLLTETSIDTNEALETIKVLVEQILIV